MPRVLISDKINPVAADIFKNRGVEVDVLTGLKSEELKSVIKDYDGLVVRSSTKVSREMLAVAENLKVIGRAGIGVDNIELDDATANGIVVMNTPYGNSITTAEHAIALMTSLVRQIPLADRSTRSGKWEKNRFMGMELCDKVLGIIGCGNIGAIVAALAIGLKMRVVTYDPYLSPEKANSLGVTRVSFDELLMHSDIITLHVPLTDETRGMINVDSLAKTKAGVFVVNCARGGLVNERDLEILIRNNHVAGAALDVFEIEPARDNPLFQLDQVIATPHLGASTDEAQENVARQIATQVADFLITGGITNAVNTPSIPAEEFQKLSPYMSLAKQLGLFAGQLTETGLVGATIEYEGVVAKLNCKPLTAILLQGLLSPILSSINIVNAPIIAKERGIDVREVKRDQAEDYQTFVRLNITTERQTRTIAGTLFGGDKARIVEIKGIKIEAELSAHMIYFTNEDKPGLIGQIGHVLGNSGVNIATFHLGRSKIGGDAIGLVSVDSEVDEGVLERLRNLTSVVQVKALNF